MVWWFVFASIISFSLGFYTAYRWALNFNLRHFALFWDIFVKFVSDNQGKIVILNEEFLINVKNNFFNSAKKNIPGVDL